MQVFKETANRKRISILTEVPIAISYSPGAPTKAHFSDRTNCSIACLGCINPKCMYLNESEVSCDAIDGFPHDQTLNACPTDAIKWNEESDVPVIDSTKCINCGICVSRCPVGALYFDKKIKVNSATSIKQGNYRIDNNSLDIHHHQIESLSHIKKSGTMVIETDELLESIYDKLSGIRNIYHNIIGRNLLIALGCKCSMRRIGDVYTRMDAIYSSVGGTFGSVEIEFGRDTLDASRGVLDDIAVLFTRYGVDKLRNKALVICLQLPNARQGYWQVVKDIMHVEQVKISTTTIGALMLLIWNSCTLIPENDYYYVDYDSMTIRDAIAQQIGRQIELSDKSLGILEPLK